MEYFKNNRDVNYSKEIKLIQPIKNQNLKEETLALIAMLNLQYWCEDEIEKQRLKKIYDNNENEYQIKLREKYNCDNLFKNKLSNKSKKFSKLIPIIVALFIAIATSLGGSLHYPIHKWIAEDKDTYSYVKEVRYIGEEKDSKDKTATDVPAYSTILGDLHAHYIDLIFSLTTIALLAQYFLEDNKQELLVFLASLGETVKS